MRIKTLACILLTALAGTTLSSGQQPGAPQIAPRSAQKSVPYGQLPLTFEANRGQAAGQVKFLSRGKGYTAFLVTGGMVLTLRPSQAIATAKDERSTTSGQASSTTLQFRLLGSSRNAAVVGEDIQPGRVNYFLGNDRRQWHTNLPTYGKVRYKNVYPGIDLVYYGNHQQLEYDFAVAPGADPRQIQFQIGGAEQIQIDPQGNLVLRTSAGELQFQNPIVYQESNGQRVPVDGGYVVRDSTHVGFQMSHYDPSKPLVIDPVLEYSTYLGGSGTDQPTSVAVDGSGNVYVAGYTNSVNFPLSALESISAGGNHAFVAKLDSSGSHLVYADYIGGNSGDYGIALALDGANNVYLAGSTASNNFPTVKPYQAQQPGPYSGFLTKVSADGSSLLYSTYLGGSTFDQPQSVAIDSIGQAIVAGYTMSRNFPMANAYQNTASANQGGIFGVYGFLTKFSPDGSSLVYSTYLAGDSNVVQDCGSPCWPEPYSVVSAVTEDANGNAYVTGTTNTYNFPATQGSYQTSNSTQQDASIGFVSKFSSAGGLDYSTYFYGASGNPVEISAITVDGTGSAYIAGAAASDGTFPITSTSICDPGTDGYGCSYAFVTKFDPTGSNLMYSTFLGLNNFAVPQSLVLDAAGDAYVLASTSSGGFQTNNALEAYSQSADLLLVEIDPSATTQSFATYLGGGGNDSASGMAIDQNGNLYVTGRTNSTDFPTTQGAYQSVFAGGGADAFVMKIGTASAPSVSLSPSSLQFAQLPVGSTSQPQVALLRNMGSSVLSISSITAAGDFAETDNCGISVPAAGSCTLSVTFTPTASGSRSGSILIQDDASGSSHSITLQGIGFGPAVALTPASLTFSGVLIGASSAPQAVTLTNTGNDALTISNVQISGAYTQTNNCPATLPSGSSCAINIIFSPTSSGTQSGALSVTDSAQGGTQTVGLTGSASDFSLSASTSSATVKAGASATYSLSISPVGGSFSNAVNLACSGLPANASCSFSPSAVTPGTKGSTVTLTIATKTNSAELIPALPSSPHRPISAVWIQFQAFGVFGIVVAGCAKRSKRLTIFILLALLVLGMLFMSGCAGGTGIAPQNGSSGTTYTVTVTGASGALQHSLPLTLTVQ